MRHPFPHSLARPAALLLVATALLGGCASNVPVQQNDELLRSAQGGWNVQISTSTSTVRLGETMQVAVNTAKTGYLYLIHAGTDGKTQTLLFPNAMDAANYLAAGVHRLPRENWAIKARGPAGVGYLTAIVSEQPQDLMKLQQSLSLGQRPIVQGAYGAGLVAIQETP